ncbi:phosphate ABC transporter permease PstA [Marinospirillum sp. MEB164]|uniref:Phosphate transport system permease protein PstA n=1 Tax=Marinospirillum alkalitolerans TaxID=3123374 RepID=A0ABW8PV17_9GAMM
MLPLRLPSWTHGQLWILLNAAAVVSCLLLFAALLLLLSRLGLAHFWPQDSASWIEALRLFIEQVWLFISSPMDQGGVFPALFGTVVLVLMMALLVAPMGILAAVYLHEYAPNNALTQLIRIAVRNLAGVPSIVYGVFGLGFFIYGMGGQLDRWFFADQLPTPTLGSPNLLWAALTLALLTLPVVIVATEEGLARIPRQVRESALALGSNQMETLWHLVLPMASPAMMTGLILAMARAAGEVAPLMLLGVVKLAPDLPIDGEAPYIHFDRQFMHLGYHVFDLYSEAPADQINLVYATALLLVGVILLLNLLALGLRRRLREKYRLLDS